MDRPLRSVFDQQLLLRITVGVIWLVASCGGCVLLAMYANSSGSLARAPPQWPDNTTLRLSEHGFTLVLFAHPRCPCTRATLGELEKIVASFQGSITTWVVFFKPPGSDENWDQTDLRETAAAIPGAHIVNDLDGVEASRFDATTSGQTLLYGDRGELLFNGGITLARGHAGDSPGRSAIESYLTDPAPSYRQTPVFGCPIAASPKQKQVGK
jgi:hypothetical protein